MANNTPEAAKTPAPANDTLDPNKPVGNGFNLAVLKANITDRVFEKVKEYQQKGELTIPKDYDVGASVTTAWFVLLETETKDKKPVLEECTPDSIANALMKMVVWGLNPMKKQCDFIAYGNKLRCNPEYTGNIAMAKRYAGLKEINAQVVYKGETFSTRVDPATGRRQLVEHIQNNENIGTGEISFVYSIAVMEDGSTSCEVMSMGQVINSWKQGYGYGENGTKAHRNFPDQMAMKTVYNRHTKPMIRTSSDKMLMVPDDETEDLGYAEIVKENAIEIRQANAGQKTLSMEVAARQPENQPVQMQPTEVRQSIPSEPEKKDKAKMPEWVGGKNPSAKESGDLFSK